MKHFLDSCARDEYIFRRWYKLKNKAILAPFGHAGVTIEIKPGKPSHWRYVIISQRGSGTLISSTEILYYASNKSRKKAFKFAEYLIRKYKEYE